MSAERIEQCSTKGEFEGEKGDSLLEGVVLLFVCSCARTAKRLPSAAGRGARKYAPAREKNLHKPCLKNLLFLRVPLPFLEKS